MIEISKELQEAYMRDSVAKKVIIRFTDETMPDVSKFVMESMQLTEILTESEQLQFGECNSAKFSIFVMDIDADIKNKEIAPVIALNDEEIPLGVFTVTSVKKVQGKAYKRLIAHDKIFNLDADVSYWYDNLTFPIKLKDFRDSLFNYLNIEQEETSLYCDDLMVDKTIIGTVNGLMVVKGICELAGCFGRMNRYGKFEYLRLKSSALYPSNDLYPSDKLLPDDSLNTIQLRTEKYNLLKSYPYYDDYVTSAIDGVVIVDNNGTFFTSNSAENPYRIQNNFLLMNKGAEELQSIADQLTTIISGVYYTPVEEVVCKGLPYVEIGDAFTFTDGEDYITSYIFSRTLEGVQSLTDTYTARGTEYLEYDGNSVENKIGNLNTQVNNVVESIVQTVRKGESYNGFIIDENGVRVEGTGAFTVDMSNLKIDENGKVEMGSAQINEDCYIVNNVKMINTYNHEVFNAIRVRTESETNQLIFAAPKYNTGVNGSPFMVVEMIEGGEFPVCVRFPNYNGIFQKDLTVKGTLYTTSGTVSKSDKKLKNSIINLDKEETASFIYRLNPCKYKLNDEESNEFHHGLIAQEVKEEMRSEHWGLHHDNGEYQALRYEELIADLIATVQTQNERIKVLENKLGGKR